MRHITDLTNDIEYFLVVDALNGGGTVSHTSCEISATPHELTFSTDIPVSSSSNDQTNPTITSNWDGSTLFMAWEENSRVRYSRSDDYGQHWSTPVDLLAGGTTQASPTLVMRRRITQTNTSTGELEIVVEPALLATLVVDGTVKFIRGDFDPIDDSVSFGTAIDIATGSAPSLAAYGDHVEVVYQVITDGRDSVSARSSANGGASFASALRVDQANTGGGEFSRQPTVAIDPRNDDVYVGYHGPRGGGDTNIYVNRSADAGASYNGEVRADDDAGGGNQLGVSLSVDGRSGQVAATWKISATVTGSIFPAPSMLVPAGKPILMPVELWPAIRSPRWRPPILGAMCLYCLLIPVPVSGPYSIASMQPEVSIRPRRSAPRLVLQVLSGKSRTSVSINWAGYS